MARSLDVDALMATLCMRAHAPCAETAGLQDADREDAAQDALLVVLVRCRAPLVSGGPVDVEDLEKALGGVLRNVTRNARRRRTVQARSTLTGMSAQDLDAFPSRWEDVSFDWREALTPKERDCLAAFQCAASNEELARLWSVHASTVPRRRDRLMRRLTGVLAGSAELPSCTSKASSTW